VERRDRKRLRLATIVARWDSLPAATRDAIAALVVQR